MTNFKSISNFKYYKLFAICLFAICLFAYSERVYAQSSTPTPEATSAAVNDIRAKVKEIVQEKLDQAQKGQKMAFVGTISEINGLNLTLQTNEGDKQLNVATDAAIIGKGGKRIKAEDLKNGLFAIAMGYLEENDVLGVRRLVMSEKPKASAKKVAFGKVTDISKEEKVLTVKNEKKGIIYTIEVNDKTTLTKKVDGKIQKVKLEVVETGDYLIAIGTPTENEHKLITAKIIHVIPGLSKPETTVTSTPSATPTTKVTPKIKATPTP